MNRKRNNRTCTLPDKPEDADATTLTGLLPVNDCSFTRFAGSHPDITGGTLVLSKMAPLKSHIRLPGRLLPVLFEDKKA